MPKIIEYFGIFFSIWSHDHYPIHVHVSYSEYEEKAEFEIKNGKIIGISFKKVRGKKLLPANKKEDALKVIKANEKLILEAWTNIQVLRIPTKITKITKRIK